MDSNAAQPFRINPAGDTPVFESEYGDRYQLVASEGKVIAVQVTEPAVLPTGGLKQLITPHPGIPCTPGMCLVYVRETYDIGPKYPSATEGWNASTYKHTDQNFPADAWVPVWFSLSDNPAGHVALRQPDGSIWSASDPTQTSPVHHTSLEDIEQYYGGRLTYLGWTEDIEGVRVIS